MCELRRLVALKELRRARRVGRGGRGGQWRKRVKVPRGAIKVPRGARMRCPWQRVGRAPVRVIKVVMEGLLLLRLPRPSLP